MKNKIFTLYIFIAIGSLVSTYAQDTLVWLKNNSGIIEDNTGSVIRWKNQMEGFGDAIQNNSALGGEQMQETYPGKVNVAFNKNGSYLELEESGNYCSDNTFSVFYVGKVGNVGSVAVMFGNFKVNSDWNNCSGLRFVRKANGDLAFQYGRPGYKHMVLNNLPENEFFFFGFSLDASGNYRYFDNSSEIIKIGAIDGSILHNTDNHKFNLANQQGGSYTYDHTEIAEFLLMDESISTAQFTQMQSWLRNEYPEVVTSQFNIDEVLPATRTTIASNAEISITFDQNIKPSTVFPKVYVNKNETEAAGNWNIADNKMTYKSSSDWPKGALVKVKLSEEITAIDGATLDIAKRSEYNFIVEQDHNYGSEQIVINPMATVDFPQAGHKLPLNLTLPKNRENKVPIHIWVHGGGWSGGTAASSVASDSPHGTYLAQNLGIATLGISYRCKGSNGSFALAMEDIDAAYQWAMANAELYNFDTTKVFFSGGSAGSPLASLAAQRYQSTIGFIGFNGIYDFVNDKNSWGQWNGYGQETPSASANSAIFNIRVNPPATILMHGDDDTTIPYTQSTLFANKINASGGDAEAVIYPGQVHAFFNLSKESYEDVLYEMVNFMRDVLIKQTVSSTKKIVSEGYSKKITIYPNPIGSGEILTFSLDAEVSNEQYTVEVLNLAGEVLVSKNIALNADSNLLSLSQCSPSPGTYLLKVANENFFGLQKIVIQ